MSHKDYALEISGVDKVREFKLVKLNSLYPLPQVIVPIINADDTSINTPEGVLIRKAMQGSGLEEIRFDSDTHVVHVAATSEQAWSDIKFIEIIVRVLINSHFTAARKM
jgi:hypothetical protein